MFERKKVILQQEIEAKHTYLILSRCVADVNYFFGNGQIYGNHLFYGDIDSHITGMIDLWKSLPRKPQWLRAVDLIQYKKRVQDFKNKSNGRADEN